MTNKNISASVRRKILDVFVGRVFLKSDETEQSVQQFREEFGQNPPGFITISPTKKCNLRCIGCYAASGGEFNEKLDYTIVDRIVKEKTKLWNSNFTVISGGEPLLWKSDGKDLLDLCAENPDNYFMMYTNGTLIDKKMAKRMAEVGNLTPAISVEGFEEETDERRGKGVFKKVLEAMANLREVGVPFGISVTATRHNVEKIVSDEFVDFFYNKQGAIYGWIFQYMPIGRAHTLDLMVTPEQRKWMFEQERHIIHDKEVFLPDFWNGGIYSSGCLAGGRAGGYIYVEWNGNITPCVFYPYSKHNIKDIYARGGTINDALKSDLMAGIRKWQRDYAYDRRGKDVHNLIAPCGIRDHYEFTHKHLETTKPMPIDESAADAVKDPEYYKGLTAYNKKFLELTDDIWQKEYIAEDNNNGKDKHGLNVNNQLPAEEKVGETLIEKDF
ncbi:radical SAM/SPASM domain-containing protein [Melioribacteraceae bacterium 4301-Me]|uniref:radical SAM/SPASM domain-containing protein n=1 Tax=Pyranulibacter aquaticus TaxID=3163344 RepID=UPI00359BC49E